MILPKALWRFKVKLLTKWMPLCPWIEFVTELADIRFTHNVAFT